mmetsp:Transcript_16536/g.24879  ORF Transcript_16536/g.24879 Transcript_16536/m.24879 type:complete len:80 (-) Transcript_16536:174-413(-)
MKCELPDGYREFSKDALWKTATFKAGDILVFDIRLVHASTANTTKAFRISMDTRWQPITAQGGNHYGFRVFQKSELVNG